ncbi:MAG: diaminopimelate epimerase, partial [Myxococcota bacterium]
VRIWNPDGSVAEKSGNGLRIFAWWWSVHRGGGPAFGLEVAGTVVGCEVAGQIVDVEIGQATFVAAEIPVDRARIDQPIDLGAETLDVVTVGVGNPHCVVFRTEVDLDALPWHRWGERLERHPAFPNRTNVQVARVVGPHQLALRVWERGAGPTLASGSSACAVAAAAVRTGRIEPGVVTVEMPGGALTVTVRDDYRLRLRGPVAPVGRFEADPDWTLTS